MEEGKADVVGLHMVTQLFERGELTDHSVEHHYVTFLAGIFRSVRFGAASAHGRANMVRFNYFLEHGAFSRDEATGKYRVDFDAMREAVSGLSELILTLQGDGDYDGVAQLIEERGRRATRVAGRPRSPGRGRDSARHHLRAGGERVVRELEKRVSPHVQPEAYIRPPNSSVPNAMRQIEPYNPVQEDEAEAGGVEVPVASRRPVAENGQPQKAHRTLQVDPAPPDGGRPEVARVPAESHWPVPPRLHRSSGAGSPQTRAPPTSSPAL